LGAQETGTLYGKANDVTISIFYLVSNGNDVTVSVSNLFDNFSARSSKNSAAG
jgi:hypothetical protein